MRWLVVAALGGCATPVGSVAQQVTSSTPDLGDPAVIALVDATGQPGCTASAIGPHTAITAAHCIAGRDPRGLRAAFGASVADGAVFVAISDGRTHPAFDPSTLAHDVALLTLRDPSPATPLALDPAPLDASLVGTTFQVVGFGTTGSSAMDAGEKRAGTARISDVQPEELTAVPNPSQPCHGDSGGPAQLAVGMVAAVVSHGDPGCSDHAVYARVDAARADLIDPYVAATAPGTVSVGDACLYDGQCADGPCLAAADDPLLYFCGGTCAHDADCPDAMRCAADGCRYREPSPGALGSSCDLDATCTSETCRDAVCTLACLGSPDVCPSDFECRGTGLEYYCFAKPAAGCGGCTSGGGAGLLAILAVIGVGRARRSARSAAPRDSRAARSR